jgi:DNA-binding XRE family transcriptional regulator
VKLVVSDPIELANAIRAVRKHAGVRLDDMAAAVGVSKQTITNLEAGRCKLSTALDVLRQLGLELSVDLPDASVSSYKRLRNQGIHASTSGEQPQGAADSTGTHAPDPK